MFPTRFITLPAAPVAMALTATARGMVGHDLTRAAKQAFSELMVAVDRAGQMGRVRTCIALLPDSPQGPDDARCRYLAGVVFGLAPHTLQGRCEQPAIPLDGTLAWWPIAPGRYAVFTHAGPYPTMHRSWAAIYRDWLPTSGERLRAVPPMEVCLNDPSETPPEELLTEIWIPLI